MGILGHFIPNVQQGGSPGVWFVTSASVMPEGFTVIEKGSIKESPIVPGNGGFVGGFGAMMYCPVVDAVA